MKKAILILVLITTSISAIFAQVKVTGSVSQPDGTPVVGAYVLVTGTTTGASTDANGIFTINNVPSNAETLTSTCIGLKTTVTPIGKGFVKIVMEEDSEFLDDVLVVAYGTASKAAFTGSASQVKGDELTKVSKESIGKALVGKVAGVRVSSDNGDPGSAGNVQIRGVGSFSASTQPLYVIDGVVIDPSSSSDLSVGYKSTTILNSINPDDVESMTVLKDAAAASLYGSRASNGVIIITTKKGKTGKTTVTYNGEIGITSVANMKAFDLMDGPTFMQYFADAYDGYFNVVDDSHTPLGTVTIDDVRGYFYDGSGNTSTDWAREVLRTVMTQSHQLSISGGNEKTKVYIGLGYTHNNGVVLGSSFQRFSGRINVDHQATNWFKVSARQMLSINETDGYPDQSDQEQGWGNSSPTSSIFQQDPTAPVKDENGNYTNQSWGGADNPYLAFEEDSYSYYNTNTLRSMSNLDFTLMFTKWLNLQNTFAFDFSDSRQYMWWGPDSVDGESLSGLKEEYDLQTKTITNSTIAHFDYTIDKHSISALAGIEYAYHHFDYIEAAANNFPTSDLPSLSVGQKYGVAGLFRNSAMFSVLSGVNYNYDNTYYASASFRRDGSSRLSEDNRWSNFWSVSGAWRLSKEDFLSGNPLFNDFKVKASFGTNGNLPTGYFDYMGLYRLGNAYASGNAIYWANPENYELGWEKSNNFNIGFEWNLFDRLQFNAEYFNKYTSALLFDMPASIVTGFNSYTANIGNISNSGVEIELSSTNFKTDDFSWTTDFNLTYLHNEIKKLPGGNDVSSGDGGLYLLREGESMYSFYLPEYIGVNEETGLGEFWIDPEDHSQGKTNYYTKAGSTILGKGIPDITGGITNTLQYKNIDLSFMISYQFGGSLFDYMEYFTVSDGVRAGSFNCLAKAADYWTPDNTDATYPRVIMGNPYRSDRWSSRHIKSTDNFRVREITLGYTLPIKKFVSNARVYVKGTNPFMIWSATPDVDPDVPINGYRTVDIPVTKSFVAGVSLTF